MQIFIKHPVYPTIVYATTAQVNRPE